MELFSLKALTKLPKQRINEADARGPLAGHDQTKNNSSMKRVAMKTKLKRLIGHLRRAVTIAKHPWDFPEMMLLQYLRDSGKHALVYVVGAYHGHEVPRLFATRGVSRIVLFEAEPRNAEALRRNTRRFTPRTTVVEAAACDYDGTCVFHEMNLAGNGSILEPGALSRESYGTTETHSLEVRATRLDTYAQSEKTLPDVLWVDVQGAELKVLAGADACLRNARMVFIEVSTWQPTYEGGCTTAEISRFLEQYGFRQIQLGTDLLNGTGNALYAKADTMALPIQT